MDASHFTDAVSPSPMPVTFAGTDGAVVSGAGPVPGTSTVMAAEASDSLPALSTAETANVWSPLLRPAMVVEVPVTRSGRFSPSTVT